MTNNNSSEKSENRSFMFYETFYDCIKSLEAIGDVQSANMLAWEIFHYGIFGKRKNRLDNPIAEASMRSIAPIIDKSVKNGEEALGRIKQTDDDYIKQLVVDRMASDMSRD